MGNKGKPPYKLNIIDYNDFTLKEKKDLLGAFYELLRHYLIDKDHSSSLAKRKTGDILMINDDVIRELYFKCPDLVDIVKNRQRITVGFNR